MFVGNEKKLPNTTLTKKSYFETVFNCSAQQPSDYFGHGFSSHERTNFSKIKLQPVNGIKQSHHKLSPQQSVSNIEFPWRCTTIRSDKHFPLRRSQSQFNDATLCSADHLLSNNSNLGRIKDEFSLEIDCSNNEVEVRIVNNLARFCPVSTSDY